MEEMYSKYQWFTDVKNYKNLLRDSHGTDLSTLENGKNHDSPAMIKSSDDEDQDIDSPRS